VSNGNILTHYFKSLYSELKNLTDGEQNEAIKKSDYYKISVKGLMLQLLKIYNKASKRFTEEEKQ
jgi:hypothetical protein